MSTASRPSGRRYSMGAHGHSETSERFGNFLLQSGCGTEVWKPSYNDGVTTVRFFPGKNPDDPNNWDPFRLGDEPRQFGDWIRRYPAVRSMGDPGATFIIKDPADDSIQLEMTPAWVLYNAINRAVNQKSDPGWGGYLKGGQGRGAQLPRPGEVYLAQCCIVQHKGKLKSPFYGAADDKHVVLEMGTSAGKALLDLCDAPVEGYQGPPENYDARFQSGDIVDPAGGRYVTFYSLKGGDPRQGRNTALTAAAAFGGGSGRQSSGGGRDEDIGFGCYVEPTFAGMGAAILAVEEQIKRKVRPWDDIVRFPTLEEQAAILCSRFPPAMILYAYQDFPSWIPETVRAKAVGQVNVAMGGHGGPLPGAAAPGYVAPAQGAAGFGAPAQGFGAPAQQPPAGAGFGGAPQQQQQPPAGAGFGAPAQGFGAPAGAGGTVGPDASLPAGGIPPTDAPFDTNTAPPLGNAAPAGTPAAAPPSTGNVAQDALARARQAAHRT